MKPYTCLLVLLIISAFAVSFSAADAYGEEDEGFDFVDNEEDDAPIEKRSVGDCWWQECQSPAHRYKCPDSTYASSTRSGCYQRDGSPGVHVYCCRGRK